MNDPVFFWTAVYAAYARMCTGVFAVVNSWWWMISECCRHASTMWQDTGCQACTAKPRSRCLDCKDLAAREVPMALQIGMVKSSLTGASLYLVSSYNINTWALADPGGQGLCPHQTSDNFFRFACKKKQDTFRDKLADSSASCDNAESIRLQRLYPGTPLGTLSRPPCSHSPCCPQTLAGSFTRFKI